MRSADYLGFVPAAGLGSRLLPLTHDYAKPAIPVDYYDNQAEYLIGYPLRALGCVAQSLLVTTHHLRHTVDAAVCDTRGLNGVDIRTLHESDLYHIGGSMLNQRRYITESAARALIMIPGDTFLSSHILETAIDRFEANQPEITFFGTSAFEGHDVFPVAESGRLHYESGQPEDVRLLGNLGVYIFRMDWLVNRLDTLPLRSDGWYDPMTDLIFGENSTQPEVDFFEVNDMDVSDLGTMESLYRHIVDHARGLDDRGNLIFPGADIAEDTDIEQSVIYPRAVIGPNVELCNSIVGPATEVVSDASAMLRAGQVMVYSAHAQVESHQAAQVA